MRGIYQIVNLVNGKSYIGQSADLAGRESKHWSLLKRGKSHNAHLQNAWDKYGENAFSFNVILYCEQFELTRCEQAIVNKFCPAYNIRLECTNSNLGIEFSWIARRNMSLAHIGIYPSGETLLKLSIARKGRSSPMKGKHHSERTKQKLSMANIGKRLSDEHKRKISKSLMGHLVSDRTRQRISEVQHSS